MKKSRAAARARSRLFVLVCLPASVGCSELLGYDEISFNEGTDSGAGAGSGGEGGTSAEAGSGFGSTSGSGGNGGSGGAAGAPGGSGGTAATGGSGGLGGAGSAGGGGNGAAGGSSGGTAATGGSGGSGGAGSAGGGGNGAAGGAGGGSSGGAGGGSSVCEQWKALNLTEGVWSGNAASCAMGDVQPPGRANALGLLNYCRSLVGLPAVTDDPAKNADSQACALMMHANQMLDHYPPASWKCYSASGAGVAIKSLLEGGGGAVGGMRILLDANDAHRFGLLGPKLGSIGIGATNMYGCIQWLPQGASAPTSNPWIPWPPAGQVPFQLLEYLGVTIPWTVHSTTLNGLGSGQMTITDNGVKLPGTVVSATDQWGFFSAIRFEPQGWKIELGHTYKVEVTGAGSPIVYQVQVIGCP